MKSKLYVTLMVVSIAVLLVFGCGEEVEKTETPSTEKVEKATEAEAPAKEMVTSAENAFETMKSEYLRKSESKIFEWDKRISDLKEKKDALPEIARKPLEEPFKAVTDSRAALDGKFNDLKGAGEDTFDEKKGTFEESLKELKTGYEGLLSKF